MVEIIKGTDPLQKVMEVGGYTTEILQLQYLGIGGHIYLVCTDMNIGEDVFIIREDAGAKVILELGSQSGKYFSIINSDDDESEIKSQQGIVFRSSSGSSIHITSDEDTSSCFANFDSTTSAIAPPRMTTTQKNNIVAPIEGSIVYDLTLHKLCVYNGTTWRTITDS